MSPVLDCCFTSPLTDSRRPKFFGSTKRAGTSLGPNGAAVVESLAGTDDENSRIAAVSEAASAVPLLRDRLRRDELVQTQFMLVFDNELYEPHATRRWRDLAQMPRADFEAEVEACLKPGGTFAALRAIMETGFGRARLG
ncbi:hypothetical protein ACVWZW_003896 [Bradyrhizobium sp. F1.13.4]